MEGYDVVTSDGSKAGRVVGVVGNHVVVEHGMLRKHRNALPLELVHADDEARVVRTTISKEMLANAPKVENGGVVDEHATAVYYGIGDVPAAPPALGGQDASVEGYDVFASDDTKVGRVVSASGRILVVEHGGLRKHRNALPLALANVDHEARAVHATVSKQILEDSPEFDGETIDRPAVASYYGLAEGFDAPSTEGYGETRPDDPGLGVEEDAHRLGVPTAGEERIETRKAMRPEGRDPAADSPGRQIHPDRWESEER